MNSKLFWLRASFFAGAVADAVFGVLILIPFRMGETEFRYPMGLAATLMFGWTALLLWGLQKPFERKGILLLTIFPVIAGLLATEIFRFATGQVQIDRMLTPVAIEISLIALLGFSYFNARNLEDE